MQRYMIALYIVCLGDSYYDSLSIGTKSHPQRFAFHSGAENAGIREFIDNGFSGTKFRRPR